MADEAADDIQSDLKKRAIRGAGFTVIGHSANFGIQMVGTIVLARLLTPSDFGLVAMVTAFSYLFQNFGLRGFTEATIQAETIDQHKLSALFWIHVALSVVVAAFFVSIGPVFAWFYAEPRLISITIVIACSFIFTALSTQHIALLTRRLKFYMITGNEISGMVIATLAAIVLACKGAGYWALVARCVAPFVCMAVGAWILCRWRPSLSVRKSGAKPLVKFAFNTYGNFAANYFSRNLDKVLIGWRHGAEALGFYERAYYLFVMPANQMSYPLTNVAVTALSRVRNDPEMYRTYYLKALSMLALVGMLLSAVLTLIGRDLLLLLLGPEWGRAGEIFQVFGPGIGVLLVYGTHGWLHLSSGNADRWFRWGIVELVVCALAFAVGLPFGAIGIAAAYTATFYLLIVPGLWYAGRPVGIHVSVLISVMWRFFISAVLAGLTSWVLLYSVSALSAGFVKLNAFGRILVASLLCTCLYTLLVISFYRGMRPISDFFSVLRDMMPGGAKEVRL